MRLRNSESFLECKIIPFLLYTLKSRIWNALLQVLSAFAHAPQIHIFSYDSSRNEPM